MTATVHEPTIILKPESVRLHDTCRIDSFCKIEGGEGVIIGAYVHIASFCHLNIGGGQLIMQRGSSAGSGVKIITGSNVPGPGLSCSAVAPNSKIVRGRVVIEEDAVLYCGAIVLPGVTVGKRAVVAAGAVVTRDVPPGETWGGIPARRLRNVKDDLLGSTPELVSAEHGDTACARYVAAIDEFYNSGLGGMR